MDFRSNRHSSTCGLKADYVGKRAVSHYDVYKQNKTGESFIKKKKFF